MARPKSEKIDVNSKPFKYYEARKTGKNKKESALIAGYSPLKARNPATIEQSEAYQTIERHFKDELLTKITISEVADALVDNIQQKDMKVIDRNSRNRAIEIALNRIEPDGMRKDEEQVIIVLKN